MTTGDVSAYLDRLGLGDGTPSPTYDVLVDLHRRHLDAVPYENLATMLGRPPSVVPRACLVRVGDRGRAGYCFHQNAALERVLRELGYAVTRWHAHVYTDESGRFDERLNHLALEVADLPTETNPDGRWWVDVGLGDGLRDPLPLVVGTYRQGPFRYELTDVRPDGWSFRHDPGGSFTGIEVSRAAIGQPAVDAAHARLTTPPDGEFTRLVVVQRRGDHAADTLRGCRWTHVDAAGHRATELSTFDAWRAVIVSELGLSLAGIGDDELRGLYAAQWALHEQWVATGRP